MSTWHAPLTPRYSHPAPLNLNDVDAANAYDAMPNEPFRADVWYSYGAFQVETYCQWRAIVRAGLRIDFHSGDHDYPNSAAMHADIDSGHLWTRLSDHDGLPDGHPMAAPSPFFTRAWIDGARRTRRLLLNDVFRAVHDVNGHHGYADAPRYSFGPNGERNAWLRHRQTYPVDALAALWCETRGQSAWTNDFADHRALALPDRPFAVQKAGYPRFSLV
jgi:hypothetical protein